MRQALCRHRYGIQKPKRSCYSQHAFYAKLLLQKLAERSGRIYLSVAEKECPATNILTERKEYRLNNILNINEGYVLMPVSNSKVYMFFMLSAIMK